MSYDQPRAQVTPVHAAGPSEATGEGKALLHRALQLQAKDGAQNALIKTACRVKLKDPPAPGCDLTRESAGESTTQSTFKGPARSFVGRELHARFRTRGN